MVDENPLAALEMDLGVPAGFLNTVLREGDDWSFVIKLHAVFEAAVAHCLAKEVGRPELSTVFAHTELNRSKTGKVEIAKALGLVTKRERRFLRSLSELRNELVHDVTNTGFTFEDHLKQMKGPKERSKFYQGFEIDVLNDYVEFGERRYPREAFFLANPRLMIWIASTVVLEYLYVHTEHTRLRRELEQAYAKLFRKPNEEA